MGQSEGMDDGIDRRDDVHLSQSYSMNAVAMAALFYVVGFPCICLWAGFGTAMRQVLSDPKRLRIFNVAMALLLVFSLYPIAAAPSARASRCLLSTGTPRASRPTRSMKRHSASSVEYGALNRNQALGASSGRK